METPTGVMNGPEGEPMVSYVRLDKRWRGGDEGLLHLRRLSRLDTLFLIDGVKVADEAVDKLQKEVENLRVQRRGPAMLGIASAKTERGCEIAMLASDSAAERADLQIGDVIVKFGDAEVKGPEDLITLARDKDVGDKVILTILRSNETVEKELILGEWK
jgi:membrane-associated protease RseP (regulator of RpoE activity)